MLLNANILSFGNYTFSRVCLCFAIYALPLILMSPGSFAPGWYAFAAVVLFESFFKMAGTGPHKMCLCFHFLGYKQRRAWKEPEILMVELIPTAFGTTSWVPFLFVYPPGFLSCSLMLDGVWKNRLSRDSIFYGVNPCFYPVRYTKTIHWKEGLGY